MKKQLTHFLALAVMATTLFSCGSARFTRSHYGQRDWARGNYEVQEKTAPEQTAANKTKGVQTETEAVSVENNATPEVASAVTPIVPSAPSHPAAQGTVQQQQTDATPTAVAEEETSSETASPLAEERVKPSSDATNGADTNTILLVILAFLIPPLAVYLKDGAVSTMFWVTLILCLLGGGWFWGWGFWLGGLYGIAIILALLYVLDII